MSIWRSLEYIGILESSPLYKPSRTGRERGGGGGGGGRRTINTIAHVGPYNGLDFKVLYQNEDQSPMMRYKRIVCPGGTTYNLNVVLGPL